jgi:hypothetical protein
MPTNLSLDRFFGPEVFFAKITEYPPYKTKLSFTRWGYESHNAIYDVIQAERPVRVENENGVFETRWFYSTNGEWKLTPNGFHQEIIKRMNLEVSNG